MTMRSLPLGVTLLVCLTSGAMAAGGPPTEHPLAPSSVMLRGGSNRRVLFQAKWRGETAPIDPTTQGGSLRIIGGPGEGDSGLVSLPAEKWTVRKRVLKYKDPSGAAAGIRSVVLHITRKGGT